MDSSQQFVWNDRLWTIPLPSKDEVPDAYRWPYVLAYVANNGSHNAAMMHVLTLQYPGLGFNDLTSSVSEPVFSHDVSESGKSSSSYLSTSRNPTQRPRPPSSYRTNTGAVSDTARMHRPSPQPTTSNASRPHGRPPRGSGNQQSSTTTAMPHTGGWMGSSATSAKAL